MTDHIHNSCPDCGCKLVKQYRRTQIAELCCYVPGEVLSDRVSISASDKEAGSPKDGDMIARNPANHDDCWLVAADYFAANFEPISAGSDEWRGALQRIQAALAPKLAEKVWTTDEMEMEVMRLRDDFRAVQRERDEATAEVARLEALFQQSHGCHHSWPDAACAYRARLVEVERERDEARKALRECYASAVQASTQALSGDLIRGDRLEPAAQAPSGAFYCQKCGAPRRILSSRVCERDAERSLNSSVGVAATAEDGHEVPAQNRQRVEPPSDPATGTTRREPLESASTGASTGAVILTHWTSPIGRKRLRGLLGMPRGKGGPTIFGGGDMLELLDALERAERRHLRYSLGIEEAIGADRDRRNTGEPAQSDANEIRKMKATLNAERIAIAEYETVVAAALKWRKANLDLVDATEQLPLLDALAGRCDALRALEDSHGGRSP